jgi:hypothetical protein
MGLSMVSPPAWATQSSDGNRLEDAEWFGSTAGESEPKFLKKRRFCCCVNVSESDTRKERGTYGRMVASKVIVCVWRASSFS